MALTPLMMMVNERLLGAASGRLRALHVDHGLQPESAGWVRTCADICGTFGVPFSAVTATVDMTTGSGTEAAARTARYNVLKAGLAPGEILLTAHHQRDQMETLLLQLFRGAGVHGLAAMPKFAARDDVKLLRPLLDVPAEVIRAYATAAELDWIEDPSNADLGMDRNYVRHELAPVMQRRWRGAAASVARSARLCAEAAHILDEVAAGDLQGKLSGNRLSLAGLHNLSAARQRNVMRFALRALRLPVPSAKQLTLALQMLQARADAQPECAWPGVRIRRYRDDAWLFAEHEDPLSAGDTTESFDWESDATLNMGPVRGKLFARQDATGGIGLVHCAGPLQVRFRRGGEKLRPQPNGRTRDLKNLLQESDVVPWMRSNIPLVYAGELLLAVGDLWVNADYAAAVGEAGLAIVWEDHPAVN
jgi:tRNA(Ile)-lysidine synthase